MLNEKQLSDDIEEAFNFDSDKDVNPAEARKRQAEKIAAAIMKQFSSAVVTSQVAGNTATGTIK